MIQTSLTLAEGKLIRSPAACGGKRESRCGEVKSGKSLGIGKHDRERKGER
jgi:hypothetical protein